MDHERVESHLRRRALSQPSPELWTEERDRELLAQMAGQAALEIKREESGHRGLQKRPWFAVALSAAALVLLWFGFRFRQAEPSWPSSYGDVRCGLDLLDGGGAPLELVRSPGAWTRPERLKLYMLLEEEAQLRVFVYDPAGDLHPLDSLVADPGEYLSEAYDLTRFASLPLGESWISVLLLSSESPIPEDHLSEVLPARLIAHRGVEARREEMERLGESLSERLGCYVTAETFPFDP